MQESQEDRRIWIGFLDGGKRTALGLELTPETALENLKKIRKLDPKGTFWLEDKDGTQLPEN